MSNSTPRIAAAFLERGSRVQRPQRLSGMTFNSAPCSADSGQARDDSRSARAALRADARIGSTFDVRRPRNFSHSGTARRCRGDVHQLVERRLPAADCRSRPRTRARSRSQVAVVHQRRRRARLRAAASRSRRSRRRRPWPPACPLCASSASGAPPALDDAQHERRVVELDEYALRAVLEEPAAALVALVVAPDERGDEWDWRCARP